MIRSLKKYLLLLLSFFLYLLIISGIFNFFSSIVSFNELSFFFDIINLAIVSLMYYFVQKNQFNTKADLMINIKRDRKTIIFIVLLFIFFNSIILLLIFEKNIEYKDFSLSDNISIIITKPIIEELFFRGVLLSFLLKNKMKNSADVIITVVLVNICFIYLHQIWNFWIILKLFAFSTVASVFYIVTRRISCSIIFHIFINFIFVCFHIEKFYSKLNINKNLLIISCIITFILLLINVKILYFNNLKNKIKITNSSSI